MNADINHKYTIIDDIGQMKIKKYYVIDGRIEKLPQDILEAKPYPLPYSCHNRNVGDKEYRFINTFPGLCGFVLKDIMFDVQARRSYLVIKIQHGKLVYDEITKKYYHELNLLDNEKPKYELISTEMNDRERIMNEYVSDDKWWNKCLEISKLDHKEMRKIYDKYKPIRSVLLSN